LLIRFPVDLDANVTPAFTRPQRVAPPRAAASSGVAGRLRRRWAPLDDDARAALGVVGTVISTMLASGLLQGAEGERLQVRVADG
jgi:hypothetical protein